jgi:hypothetical protein
MHPNHPQHHPSRSTRGVLGAVVSSLLVLAAALAQAAEAQACPAGMEGVLAATLRGAVNTQLDWRGAEVDCDGMPRPADGSRLRFRGELETGAPLTVLIGIDDLAPGVTGREMPANVTLVFEGTGLFFGSRQQTGCWADVADNLPLPGSGWRVSGEVYCVHGLAEIGGSTSVTITELKFTGALAAEGEHAPPDQL